MMLSRTLVNGSKVEEKLPYVPVFLNFNQCPILVWLNNVILKSIDVIDAHQSQSSYCHCHFTYELLSFLCLFSFLV